jgi:hypothetical protein
MLVQPYSSPLSERPASPSVPRPPIVPSDGVTPRPPEPTPWDTGVIPVGAVVPVRLVPVRARDVVLRDEVDRDAVRRVPLAPVRRVLPVLLLVVARAPVRPEVLRRVPVLRRLVAERVPVERVPVLRRLTAERVPVLRRLTAERVPVLRRLVAVRVPVERVAVLRRLVAVRLAAVRVPVERVAVLRRLTAVLRPAEPVDLRADARPPRAPSVFAADLTRLVVLRRLTAERVPVERFAVERLAVERVPVLRVPVERFAVERFAVERVPVLRRVVPPLLRDAVVRRVPVEREAVLRFAVLRPDVDRRVAPPDERVLVPVDLLRAVAICSLLVGDVGGNADVCSMRVASADIQQEPHLSYFEMSSTRSPVCASDALRAMSACATMPTSSPSSSTTGKRRTW